MMLNSRDVPHSNSSRSAGKVSQENLMIITWGCFGVATSFWVTRIIIRLNLNSRLNLDDLFVTLALCLLLAHACVLTEMAGPMYDVLRLTMPHSTFVPPPDFLQRTSYFLKCQFAATCLFWTCLWAVKASFLAFYKKLTVGIKYLVIAWWTMAAFIAMAYVASIVSYPVSCASFVVGICESPQHVRLSLVSLRMSTALDVISDAMIIGLPLFLLFRVKLHFRTKLVLAGVFLMGGFIMAFAIIRIIVTNTQSVHPEVSWLNLWSAIECSIAVIVGCLTVFKQLLTRRRAGYSIQAGDSGKRSPGASVFLASQNVATEAVAVPLGDHKQRDLQDRGHIRVTTNVTTATSINSSGGSGEPKVLWKDDKSPRRAHS